MRIKPTTQVYNNYSASDREVWQLLCNRQAEHLHQYASTLYLEALTKIGFTADHIPEFAVTNRRLEGLTGWRLAVAPELVPEQEFFQLLSQRIFPATCWLRKMEELDYLEEPDMFHDVFGHAPLLTNKAYTHFMEQFGILALKWMNHPAALKMLSAVYWFTIEFGLLAEGDEVKIFGAGIISSIGETNHALSPLSQKLPFDIHKMMHTPYRTDILQEQYFVIKSFEQLCDAIPDIALALEEVAARNEIPV